MSDNIPENFSWVPIYREAAGRLREFSERQDELIDILVRMHAAGLKASPIMDKDASGAAFTLEEIDPFTFLANFNRGITDANRRALWEFLKKDWELESSVPEDFDGLPLANLQNSWLIPWKSVREPDHVPLLWKFFDKIFDTDLSSLDLSLMDRCLSKRGVGLANLTMGMFWSEPGKWVATDGKNVAFAKEKLELSRPRNAEEYSAWAKAVETSTEGNIFRFSHDAHLDSLEKGANPLHRTHPESNDGFPAPFDRLFDDKAEADRVFDAFREAILILQDGELERHPALTTSLRKVGSKNHFIRLNFGKWAILAYDPNRKWQFLLSEEDATKLSKTESGTFADNFEGRNYSLSNWSDDEIFFSPEWQEKFRASLSAAMALFADYNGSSYIRSHRPRLYNAMMDPNLRDPLLEEGLPETIHDKTTDSPTFWVIAPGEQATHWELFQRDNIASIGWNDCGDLSLFADKSAIEEAVELYYPEAGAAKVGRMLEDFSKQMKRGDLVVAKQGRNTAIGWGIVTGEYAYNEIGEPYVNSRTVNWKSTESVSLPEEIVFPVKTLTGYDAQSELMLFLADQYGFATESAVSGIAEEIESSYTRENALHDLFLAPDKLDRIEKLLQRKKNIILQGAPGTGKTYIARRIAYLLMGVADPARAPMTQFHQSTSYEDFVQGFRPDPEGRFVLRDGVFYQFCRTAAEDPGQNYVFIIDEINRGNLSKILGELMMLIEPDKRTIDHAVRLVYGDSKSELFHVPSNVYVIGTMNTADRSLSLVDYALRRRFAFVEMDPGFDSPTFADVLGRRKVSPGLIERIRRVMNRLNQKIADDSVNLGRGYRIGHSFFVPTHAFANEEEWFREIIDYEVRPLVEEYYADDAKSLAEIDSLLGE